MISIVIPAHNEEAVIGRGLKMVAGGARPGELEVIVACNGCTDRTADVARRFGGPVRVIEVDRASKAAALNAGDDAARGFPRIYLDADVQLDLASVRRLAAALERDDALLVFPSLRMDFGRASWFVRAYYRFWTALPYNRSMVGTGVYALSRTGRARFDCFPEVIADDGFVRFSFAPHERQLVPEAVVRVRSPQTFADLVRIKTRSRLGQFQLRQRCPGMKGTDGRSSGRMLSFTLASPGLWPCLSVYLAVNIVSRVRARRQMSDLGNYQWEQDRSSRELSS